MDGNDKESTAACAFSHHCNEVGVHSAEVVVVDIVGDGHTVIAFLLAGRFAIHMAELGAAVLRVPRHLQGKKNKVP